MTSLPLNDKLPHLVPIPGGAFRMGSDDGPLIERPVHEVEVDGFHMGVTPVTRFQYARFLSAAGHSPPPTWDDPLYADPLQPAVSVSWHDAETYCKWLSELTGQPFRLPTEAEREHAARGGREGLRYPWGDDYPDLATAYGPQAWGRPLPVGCGDPNGFGLFNMADTVHEWCLDYYDPDYYAVSPRHDPAGPANGPRRVARGGAWRHQVPVSRCSHRTSLPPDRTFTDFGFRVVTG
jgi:formylglycine-generating enzyme required for sulfatase activity